MSYPRNITMNDKGCLVRRVAPSATTPTWQCTFWAHGAVFIGHIARFAQPTFGDIALSIAVEPHRWMALPAKPVA